MKKITGFSSEGEERKLGSKNDLTGYPDFLERGSKMSSSLRVSQKEKIEDKAALIREFFELTKNIRATKDDVVAELIRERHEDAV